MIYPDKFLLFFVIGALWEIIELSVEYQEKISKKNTLCKYINTCSDITVSRNDFWKSYFGKTKSNHLYFCSKGVYGQLLDITINTLGYLTGMYLHKYF